MSLKRKLSDTLWALKKWYAIDTNLWKFPISQEFGAVALWTATAVLAATTLWTGVTTKVTTWITSPATYRAVSITWNASWIVWDVVIAWRDWAGRSITDTIAANWTSTVDWVKAFVSIDYIVLPARTASWNTISIWTSWKLGLYRDILVADDVLSVYVDWVREAVASTNVANDTITVTTAFNWTKRISVNYLTTNF